MHVLIVTDSPAHRESVERSLVESAHTVTCASSVAAALARVDEQGCDVAVIEWATGQASSVDFLRRLRAHEGHRHIYTIVVMSNATASTVAAAFAAGADDLLRRPFVREELVARVGAMDRIRRWANKILVQADNLATDIAKLGAWKRADSSIGHDLGSFVDRRLESRPTRWRGDAPLLAAEVRMSMADEGVDCRLSVGVDAASRRGLAQLLLGDESAADDLVVDMVKELANVAGGAFVSAADAEGFSVTLGLPEMTGSPEPSTEARGVVQEFTLGVVDSDISISIRIAMVSPELKNLKPRQLVEGMVVARNVMNDHGAILVAAGTRLTETSVSRLATLLAPHSTVIILGA